MMNPLTGNEYYESVSNTLKEKIRNPFYGTFALAWCITNWKILYVTIFVSEESLKSQGIQKLEYITQLYAFSDLNSALLSLGKLFILPFFSVFFIFWILSKVDHMIFEKATSNRVNKQIAEKKLRQKLLSEEKKEISKETEVIKAKDKKTKVVLETVNTERSEWDDEYENISKLSNFRIAMNDLQVCIYQWGGWKELNNYQMDPTNITLAHVNGLIEDPNVENGKLKLTTKGVYFMQKFINSNY